MASHADIHTLTRSTRDRERDTRDHNATVVVAVAVVVVVVAGRIATLYVQSFHFGIIHIIV